MGRRGKAFQAEQLTQGGQAPAGNGSPWPEDHLCSVEGWAAAGGEADRACGSPSMRALGAVVLGLDPSGQPCGEEWGLLVQEPCEEPASRMWSG